MKLLMMIAITLTSAFALATPKLGDRADYRLTLMEGDQSLVGKATLELVSYNAANKTFKQRTTVNIGNQGPQIEEADVKAEEMLTDAVLAQLTTQAGCDQAQGVLESIQTPAGTFTTCRLQGEDQGYAWITWLGQVPMGIVRYASQSEGLTQLFELTSAKAGK